MTDLKITLKTDVMHALAQAASKNDVRYYLNGILLEYNTKLRDVQLVATDGHILFAYVLPESYLLEGPYTDDPEVPEGGRMQWIIPRDAVSALSKSTKTKDRYCEITAQSDNQVNLYDVTKQTTQTVQAVEGQFPEWRRVVPTENRAFENPNYPFDPALVGRCGKIAATLNGDPSKTQNMRLALGSSAGDSALIVPTTDEPWAGVIMPIRTHGDREGIDPIAHAARIRGDQ